jgi:hypothetical protein
MRSDPSPDVHPRIHQAMAEASEIERNELRRQLEGRAHSDAATWATS